MIIVHVMTRLMRGGAEENTLRSCRAQAAAGHRVILVHGADFDPAAREEAAGVVEVRTVDRMFHRISPADDIAAVRALRDLFREVGADVVHTHQSKAGVLGRVAARLARTPTVIHGIHILPFVNVGPVQEAVYVAAEWLCAPFTHGFISVSPSVRDECVRRGLGRPEKHFVAMSAMDVERFKTAGPPPDWRTLLAVEPGQDRPPTAVMLATFEPRKRQLEFIRAVPEAFAGLPDWRLLFAGRGETLEEAKALVEEMGLGDRIRFAGHRSDPEAIIAMADIGLLTSLREGLPRVLVQYAAAGKPAVVSLLPGIGDVVTDDVSAIVTPTDDIGAAAEAAARLLGDAVLRRRLSNGALGVDVDAWSPERMDAAVEEAYRQVRAA
ncbi:glycosyltransferase [Brevundimonas sp.]|uniref:glycosyltransferase n=1 Tax=Brevundimonas sp. TaxID=1871086 RepID=UPI003D11F644